MTYTIPPGTPKAAKAATFGRELVKACTARGVPLKELERVTGVGHTSLDNYRRGLILPKVEVARALAAALDAPRLAVLIVLARTFACARKGCARTFVNDTGAPRKYCSPSCLHIAQNLREASRRARRAGQTGDKRTANAATAQLRSGLRIADERAGLLEDAIAAMCTGCEPEGVCRVDDCPLRPFSPLPLEVHRVRGRARTEFEIRQEVGRRPEVIAGRSAAMKAHHADPEYAARHSASLRAAAARQTPDDKAASAAKAKASYPAERRSVVSKRMHAARRETRSA